VSKHTVECLGFKPLARNTLVGFAKVRISELKLVINDVALHQKGDSRWAALPAKPQIRDGALIKDEHDKIAYLPVLEFESREAAAAFSAAVWRAVEAVAPPAEATP
jgi:hypothetical protein